MQKHFNSDVAGDAVMPVVAGVTPGSGASPTSDLNYELVGLACRIERQLERCRALSARVLAKLDSVEGLYPPLPRNADDVPPDHMGQVVETVVAALASDHKTEIKLWVETCAAIDAKAGLPGLLDEEQMAWEQLEDMVRAAEKLPAESPEGLAARARIIMVCDQAASDFGSGAALATDVPQWFHRPA